MEPVRNSMEVITVPVRLDIQAITAKKVSWTALYFSIEKIYLFIILIIYF